MAGCFVAVVGPSGVGKDTLIGHARAALAGDRGFLFVRRLVTRAGNAFEDHDTIDEAAFEAGHAGGSFALSWRAHGLGYALPADTVAAIGGSSVAICNLSRRAIPEAQRRFARVRVVRVTAPPEILAGRLAARGRESAEAVAERLRREAEQGCEFEADLTIQNDRPLSITGGELVEFLSRLKEEQGVLQPSP